MEYDKRRPRLIRGLLSISSTPGIYPTHSAKFSGVIVSTFASG